MSSPTRGEENSRNFSIIEALRLGLGGSGACLESGVGKQKERKSGRGTVAKKQDPCGDRMTERCMESRVCFCKMNVLKEGTFLMR